MTLVADPVIYSRPLSGSVVIVLGVASLIALEFIYLISDLLFIAAFCRWRIEMEQRRPRECLEKD